MLLGKSPFRGDDEEEIFDAILSDEPLYPIHMPRESVAFLQVLLTRDPSQRLGSGPGDAVDVMNHPYFRNIDFQAMLELRIQPPFLPKLESDKDFSYFDAEFTSEKPKLTPINVTLTVEMQHQFRGFTYLNEEEADANDFQ